MKNEWAKEVLSFTTQLRSSAWGAFKLLLGWQTRVLAQIETDAVILRSEAVRVTVSDIPPKWWPFKPKPSGGFALEAPEEEADPGYEEPRCV